MILVVLFFLLIVYPCEGLLQGNDNPSTGELLSIIHQLNQTLQTQREKLAAQEVNLAKQNNEIAVLKTSHQTKQVAFYVALSTHTHLGSHQVIEFDQVISNVGNGFNVQLGHFIAPVGGVYIFSVSALPLTVGKGLHLQLIKNGNEIGRTYCDSTGLTNAAVSTFVQLNTGDIVWVRHMDAVGSSDQGIYGELYSSFGGALISVT